MPEVEDQKRAVGGADASMAAQVAVFQAGDSGPCSWIIVAVETAAERVGAKVRRDVRSIAGAEGRVERSDWIFRGSVVPILGAGS